MIIGQYRELLLRHLNIRPLTQRRINWKQVARLVKNWEWRHFTPVVLAKRRNKYYVVDGQHRVLALRERCSDYNELIPCWVVPAKTVEAEADLFLGLNKLVRPSKPDDRYHVSLGGNHEAEETVEYELSGAGITNVYGSTRLGENETRCGYLFTKAYKRLGLKGLRRVIRCVKSSREGKTIDPVALRATFIEGVIEYVGAGNVAMKTMFSPEEVLRKAGRASLSNGYKRAPAIAEVLERSCK